MKNEEWGMGNGEWGMENGEWGMGNGEQGIGIIKCKIKPHPHPLSLVRRGVPLGGVRSYTLNGLMIVGWVVACFP